MSSRSRNLPNDTRPMPTASFALRPTQIEQIRKIATERRVSQSMIVRDAVDLYFDKLGKEAAAALRHSGQRLLNPSPTAQSTPKADDSERS